MRFNWKTAINYTMLLFLVFIVIISLICVMVYFGSFASIIMFFTIIFLMAGIENKPEKEHKK